MLPIPSVVTVVVCMTVVSNLSLNVYEELGVPPKTKPLKLTVVGFEPPFEKSHTCEDVAFIKNEPAHPAKNVAVVPVADPAFRTITLLKVAAEFGREIYLPSRMPATDLKPSKEYS